MLDARDYSRPASGPSAARAAMSSALTAAPPAAPLACVMRTSLCAPPSGATGVPTMEAEESVSEPTTRAPLPLPEPLPLMVPSDGGAQEGGGWTRTRASGGYDDRRPTIFRFNWRTQTAVCMMPLLHLSAPHTLNSVHEHQGNCIQLSCRALPMLPHDALPANDGHYTCYCYVFAYSALTTACRYLLH